MFLELIKKIHWMKEEVIKAEMTHYFGTDDKNQCLVVNANVVHGLLDQIEGQARITERQIEAVWPKGGTVSGVDNTNILLGKISGRIENVAKALDDGIIASDRRQRDWEKTIINATKVHVKSQKVAMIFMFSVMTVVSSVVSVLINLIMP